MYFSFKERPLGCKVLSMKRPIFLTLLSLSLFLSSIGRGAESKSLQIVCLGDSLTAGYGIDKEKAYPELLENKLNKGKEKSRVKVLNGGVSGSTTASGKSRLKWYLKKSSPDVLILALGANDGLRGLKLSESQKNLEEIIELAKSNNMKVLLVGMRLPPNYGQEYVKSFKEMYTNLQKKYQLPTMPFMLKDVGGVKELNIEDGIHPNEKGHEIIAENLLKSLRPLINQSEKK